MADALGGRATHRNDEMMMWVSRRGSPSPIPYALLPGRKEESGLNTNYVEEQLVLVIRS